MDIAPVYELRTRLRAAAIAGTSLLSEDFRLKKAAESFAPLAAASPVFARINEMTAKLLSDNSPEGLLDAITLVDAVITTLGIVEVSDVSEDIAVAESGTAIVNAPYSRLSALIGALTGSGGGQYNAFMEIKQSSPELFRDYRVKPMLVKGLGASYSELADEVENTIADMGAEMLPLLKRDFDPKGKRDMLRRVNLIESIGGAGENDFYLGQLENAEKDVRKALIYALRHDEGNIDRLIDLAKTEKSKPKAAALAALASFDCERSAEFFGEYAEKKPAEVIDIMHNVSSKWSSELTARLIDRLLVDNNDNRITLSQAADVKKVKLKANTDFNKLTAALWGKWGADIEKIYREFENKESARKMSVCLSASIIVTQDEGLKALALELNGRSKLKGHYDYAEAAARLLGTGDCSEWMKKMTRELRAKSAVNDLQAVYTNDLVFIMRFVRYNNGGYELRLPYFDDITDRWVYISAPITQPMEQLLDIYINGNYFVEKFIKKPDIGLLGIIRKMEIKNVKGLVSAYFDRNEEITQVGIRGFFNMLPGDDDFKLAEAREIVGLARKGKLKAKIDVDEFSLWVESGMK